MPPDKEKDQKTGTSRASRKAVLLTGIIAQGDGTPGPDCTIRDLSPAGARIVFKRNARLPSDFYLINIRDRVAYDARLAWNKDSEAGIAFKKTLPLADIADPKLTFLKRLWLSRATR